MPVTTLTNLRQKRYLSNFSFLNMKGNGKRGIKSQMKPFLR